MYIWIKQFLIYLCFYWTLWCFVMLVAGWCFLFSRECHGSVPVYVPWLPDALRLFPCLLNWTDWELALEIEIKVCFHTSCEMWLRSLTHLVRRQRCSNLYTRQFIPHVTDRHLRQMSAVNCSYSMSLLIVECTFACFIFNLFCLTLTIF